LPEAELRSRLASADAAAIIKVGRHFEKIRRILDDLGLAARAHYIERATLGSERVLTLNEAGDNPAPYFSMILIRGDK
jgi:precorrin-2/cobalt-factor-2 C20-methyltransferase